INGELISASLTNVRKETNLDLWQLNLQDKLTFKDTFFVQLFGGVGYVCQAKDKAFITVPIFASSNPTFDFALPYNNMGTASVNTQEGETTDLALVAEETFLAYSKNRHGWAWSFDAAFGLTLPIYDMCFLDKIAFEPRIGYTGEWLKVSDSFRT